MVLCLLVYRLAEVRVRQRLVASEETVRDQLRRPTHRPTMRWLFQCFEGLDLHHLTWRDGMRHTQVLRLTALHRQGLRLLGPAYENCYLVPTFHTHGRSQETLPPRCECSSASYGTLDAPERMGA